MGHAPRFADRLEATASSPPPEGSRSNGREGIDDYINLGYVPADRHVESVSKTLEYAYADWALANLADRLNRPEASVLRSRSRNYVNLYHPTTGFMQPRNSDGAFDPVASSTGFSEGSGPFTEGDAWHWLFYVPHDPIGLATLLGGPRILGERLDLFFRRADLMGPGWPTTALPNSYYWHGNEPDIRAPYLFHAADRSDQVGRWIRTIQSRLYRSGPDGLPGNDDGGTLSAWYLFSALGLYPIAGGDSYHLGSPLFPHAELRVTDGTTLTIRAPRASRDVAHVRRVYLNGEPVSHRVINHTSLLGGSTLEFEMDAGGREVPPQQ